VRGTKGGGVLVIGVRKGEEKGGRKKVFEITGGVRKSSRNKKNKGERGKEEKEEEKKKHRKSSKPLGLGGRAHLPYPFP